MFFARGHKSVERQGIFANVRMNEKGHFGVQFAECRVRRERHLHEVAHAAHVHKHLIRSFFGKPSVKLANHRSPVLPLFLRPSTRIRDCGYSREKGTTPWGAKSFKVHTRWFRCYSGGLKLVFRVPITTTYSGASEAGKNFRLTTVILS